MTVSKTMLYCKSHCLNQLLSWRVVGSEEGNNGEGGILQGELSCANQASHLGLNEYYSGFENIGHNDPLSLIFLWIIPK